MRLGAKLTRWPFASTTRSSTRYCRFARKTSKSATVHKWMFGVSYHWYGSDLERGLAGFDDAAFDVVILSQTLQAMRRVEAIVAEMLRVGREAIVTFPNFGHWSHRLQIARGRMPVSSSLPYQWYDTPNIHLCTVADFEDRKSSCRERV